MTDYKYAYQGEPEGTARAVARSVQVSTKTAVMIAKFLRGKTVARAKKDLELVLKKKIAVPFTRFTEGAGHKPGIGPGKYPEKATKAFLETISNAEANAMDLGLGDELKIQAITVHKGAVNWHYGRIRGRKQKNTNIEVVLKEIIKEKKPETKKEEKKPEQPKKEAESKKQAPKKEPSEKKTQAKTTPKPAAKENTGKTAAKKATAKKEVKE